MRKSRTHFEQIPLEVVKKIAEEEDSENGKAGADNVIVEPGPRQRRTVRRGPDVRG